MWGDFVLQADVRGVFEFNFPFAPAPPEVTIRCHTRPHVHSFLREVATMFEVVAFTSATKVQPRKFFRIFLTV